VALLAFFAWVLLTLPIQPALILVVADTVAWVGLGQDQLRRPLHRHRHLVLSALLLYLLVWESKEAATPSPATTR
jgi:hypothetical protein